MNMRNFNKQRKQSLEPINEELENSRFTEKKHITTEKKGGFSIPQMPWQQYEIEPVETKTQYMDDKDTVMIEGLPNTMIEALKDRFVSEGAVDSLYDYDNNRLFIQFPTPVKAKQKMIEMSELCKSPVYNRTTISILDSSVIKRKGGSYTSAPDINLPVKCNLYKIFDYFFNW